MTETIESLLKEQQEFHPSADFVKQANMNDPHIYEKAEADIEGFWEGLAGNIDWFKKWDTVLDWQPPHAKWFSGGKLNASYNCLDRHVQKHGDKPALIWEGEMENSETYTYKELRDATARFAAGLKELGVKKGDVVTIYLPMVPEAVISMLACSRIGAPHSVVFAGFSSEALAQRVEDAHSRFVITCNGYFHKGNLIQQKERADKGLENAPAVEKVIVVDHAANIIPMKEERDIWWNDLIHNVDSECEPEHMDSEDTLFIMYTSGTTGRPKGVVHTTGGYMVGTNVTSNWIFDLKDDDIFWCTADVGWITGHSYLVYGPLSNGATIVMHEGAPDYPDKGRFWDIVEKYGVTIFYTAPTAIRTFMKWGDEIPAKYDLSSLRLLGSVGEPINPKAWLWYYETIGKSKCPIVDTWWQTETGMIMISPLPGITTMRPGTATRPFPGIKANILDDEGNEVPMGSGGYLALQNPWPSMIRTINGDEQRFIDTYWSKWGADTYLTGDGARKDEDGNFWILGRLDDVIKVSGHRLGTMEIESALVSHPSVAEAAVDGKVDEIKGEVICAYVILESSCDDQCSILEDELKQHVVDEIGPIARPKMIIFTEELPKTRSGKIMRRVLKAITNGTEIGDISTLQDPAVVEDLKRKVNEIGEQ
ncbi:acetate--CoA ligase [Methanococcoides burtonii]|uniref:Acetyl-coenzyme A synthetase n=1 Tax=Methanococcoides burtonii (strain DSM 6242 / NBRC 107633 / OCM 468 / ACE-M) TaxID=259564 RepID=Q12X88_METBU|nr:acetate--CoA ligase [Methanococcoides burtonii]ABE51938.1 Acetyl-coenzyme A synthetase [Methanococcoides burtonii DSM 6242]